MKKQTSEQAFADIPAVAISRPRFIFAFVVLYVLFLLDFAARLGVTSVFPVMKEALGLSDSQIGVTGSAVLCGMTLFVLPFSFLADKTSKKRAVSFMGTWWGIGCLLCGLVSPFAFILFGRFMVGMGNASYAPVSVSMLTSWTRKSRWGSVIGAYNSAMSVGIAAGTTVAAFLAQSMGWRAPFIVIGGLTIFFSLLSLFLPKEAAQKKTASNTVRLREAFGVTLKNRTLVLLGIGVGLANMVYSSMIAWIPMFLVRESGWTSAEVGTYMGPVYLVAGLVVTPLSGVISDWLGRLSKRTRAWFGVPCFLLLALCFGCGFHFKLFPLIALGVILFLIPITGVHIATQELVPSRYKASAYGTYVTFLQGLGFFGPMLVGALSDAFGLHAAIVYAQAILIPAALIMLCAGFTYSGDYERARKLDAKELQTN